jgi:hypothetical protein
MIFTGLPTLRFLPLWLQELSAVSCYPVEHPHVDPMSCLSSREHPSNQTLKDSINTHLDFPAPIINRYLNNSPKCRPHHHPQVFAHRNNPIRCFHTPRRFSHIYQQRYTFTALYFRPRVQVHRHPPPQRLRFWP